MRQKYDSSLKATITLDDAGQIRTINHTDEYYELAQLRGRAAAAAYLHHLAARLNIAPETLHQLDQRVSYYDPQVQDVEYRFSEEKLFFDSGTYAYFQTYLNTPVWAAGLTTTVKQAPTRIIAATNTSAQDIDAKLPSAEAIETYRQLFATAEKVDRKLRVASAELTDNTKVAGTDLLIDILGMKVKTDRALERKDFVAPILRSGRFFVYRYDPEKRTEDFPHALPLFMREQAKPPSLPVPPVPKSIQAGRWYLVAELIIRLPYAGGHINWRALVELESNTILYLRALAAGINGQVFVYDPITSSGSTGNSSDQSNTVLNPHRDEVELLNLNSPVARRQYLDGAYATLGEVLPPEIRAPTRPVGRNFDFDVRTNEFAAVNAYYHVDRFFRLVEDLGFPLATYFDGTDFPIDVDHRGLGGGVNAFCFGDINGIDSVGFGLAETTDTTNPVGIATDWRVHLHELGGHGILYDHVESSNFNFAHSAGDSFAFILNDYASKWHDGAALDRYVLAPFVPLFNRRCDRGVDEWSVGRIRITNSGTGYTSAPTVTITGGGGTGAEAYVPEFSLDRGSVFGVMLTNYGTGYTSAPSVTFSGGGGSGATATATIGNWAWGGGMDNGGYKSEEILSATLFRAYRSIGGDAGSLARREFAARFMAYLILRAVGTLTRLSNPDSPAQFLSALLTADGGNWISEGVYGGAYGKVLSWAFEKQRLNDGMPPDVDVYIDDGRAGEYEYLPMHWATKTIWNRRKDDGLTDHQEPALGKTNYAYVKVRNRGTTVAHDVIVKGYHCKPFAGVLWPNDLQPFVTPELPAGTLEPNNTEEKIVGPFKWVPVPNAWGHDCMLMIVSATGDPSNVDKFGIGEVIADWRLVPNDNNVAQRNVVPVPGAGGRRGLMGGLQRRGIWVYNPGRSTAKIAVSITLPPELRSRGWKISIGNLPEEGQLMKAREQRFVVYDVHPGKDFTKGDVAAMSERRIIVTVTADGAIIGGMIYEIDPEMKMPFNERADEGNET